MILWVLTSLVNYVLPLCYFQGVSCSTCCAYCPIVKLWDAPVPLGFGCLAFSISFLPSSLWLFWALNISENVGCIMMMVVSLGKRSRNSFIAFFNFFNDTNSPVRHLGHNSSNLIDYWFVLEYCVAAHAQWVVLGRVGQRGNRLDEIILGEIGFCQRHIPQLTGQIFSREGSHLF